MIQMKDRERRKRNDKTTQIPETLKMVIAKTEVDEIMEMGKVHKELRCDGENNVFASIGLNPTTINS